MSQQATCETCTWWFNRRANGAAECRRYPPTVLIGGIINPLTVETHFCGEHSFDPEMQALADARQTQRDEEVKAVQEAAAQAEADQVEDDAEQQRQVLEAQAETARLETEAEIERQRVADSVAAAAVLHQQAEDAARKEIVARQIKPSRRQSRSRRK